jgi:hypothetical protein
MLELLAGSLNSFLQIVLYASRVLKLDVATFIADDVLKLPQNNHLHFKLDRRKFVNTYH